MCKLLGLSFFDFGRRLGSLALSAETTPSGHCFHFLLLHSRGFLDCKAPLKCLAMVLKLGGRLNLDGCVEQAL